MIVYRLVAPDTIEEKVMALKARKGALVASILDAGLEGEAGAGAAVGGDDAAGPDAASLRAAEAITADDLRALLDD